MAVVLGSWLPFFSGKKVLKTNKKCETKFLGEKKVICALDYCWLSFLCVCVCVFTVKRSQQRNWVQSPAQSSQAIASKTLLPESIEKKLRSHKMLLPRISAWKVFFRRRLFDKIENYFFVKFHWCGRVCQSFCPFRCTREISIVFLTLENVISTKCLFQWVERKICQSKEKCSFIRSRPF